MITPFSAVKGTEINERHTAKQSAGRFVTP